MTQLNTVILLQTAPPQSLEFAIFVSKVCIWDLGMRLGLFLFWEHVIQILIRKMNFQYLFSHLRKVKIFCIETYTPYCIIKYFFSRNNYVCPNISYWSGPK
jgi:hypothetical protein